MAQNEQNNGDGRDEVNGYAKYMGVAFQMLVIIGICTFAGYKIDEAANHQTKWVTALLALLGVFASLFLVIRSVKN
ncbi:AtpZ/AtpI family protein [Mucilaginibacter flavus]|uniref:AtpZ/AtpI family protein n=1 Tax=Mucilaginibacter flavus TaxID=931504 RepID=UPI0025B51078|nr:AtpZ/AtpI family protein [Mucilaginibacter flavus]MDN3584147.1 AtpZ/AtpI family protein [Mucilaginibacter flavus]